MAYNINEDSRAEILKRFPAKFPIIHANHITIAFDVEKMSVADASIKVVGYASSEEIECLVVEVNGQTKRETWGIYHITISHVAGVYPVKSNVILKEGFTPVEPFEIKANPEFFPFGGRKEKS